MKATDLMIGDWVYAKVQVDDTGAEPVFEKTPKRVTDLTKGINGIYVEGTSTFAGAEIEPIPLTPEILEENGIKLSSTNTHPYRDGEWEEGELEEAMKHYPMYVYQKLNPYITFVIRPNEQELKVRSSNYKTIVEKKEEVIFVHELQHALRLCGIDKEIVL